ncbi:MAG TPA: hypothetical protein VNQ77_20410 [Frankiaceae bacterium]|nr:hypothetical protein [Frankiaceae bacterium]
MTPFTPVRTTLAVAGVWAAAAGTWLVAGSALPGGRWLAVHLFTLGVLTNLLADLMRHFAATLLHVRDDGGPHLWRIAARNAGVLLVLTGRVSAVPWLVAAGATVVSAEVLLGWRDVRRMRRRALPARHAPVVRAYQRAYGAFLHAALLGALLGTGVLPGRWYANVRLAHLHVALLGWAGVPVLATLVFLGPTLLRARVADGADGRARRLLPVAAYGVTAASFALLLGLRPVAAIGVAAFAWAATVLCWDVVRLRGAAPNSALAVALGWLVLAAWADAALLALDATAYLDAVGALALVGGLAPVVVAAAGYIWAMSAGADVAARTARLGAVARWATVRAVLWHGGTALLATALLSRALDVPLPGALSARTALLAVVLSAALSAVSVATTAARRRPRFS